MLVAIPELPESSNSQQASQNTGDEAQQPQGQAAQPAGAASPEDSMSTRKPPLWGRSGGNSRTVTGTRVMYTRMCVCVSECIGDH
jgi:hypothetical protein